jgi:hypothetical protein
MLVIWVAKPLSLGAAIGGGGKGNFFNTVLGDHDTSGISYYRTLRRKWHCVDRLRHYLVGLVFLCHDGSSDAAEWGWLDIGNIKCLLGALLLVNLHL